MNHYYSNTSKSWYPEEDAQLRVEHKYRNLPIMKLAHIHKRTPGNIMRRLKKLNLIKYITEVHGYDAYRNSDLYYVLNEEKLKTQNQEQEQQHQPQKNTLETIPEDDEEESALDYSKSESPWTQEENNQLIKLHTQPLLNIAKVLNRHPGDIAHQMKDLKIFKALHLINGYTKYKTTQLYVEYQKANRKKKVATPEPNPAAELKAEIIELKRDFLNLKMAFNELEQFIRSAFASPNAVFKSALTKIYNYNR